MSNIQEFTVPDDNQDIQNLLSAISHDLGVPIGSNFRLSQRLPDLFSQHQQHWLGFDRAEDKKAFKMLSSLRVFSELLAEKNSTQETNVNEIGAYLADDPEMSVEVGTLPRIRGCRGHWFQLFHELARNAKRFQDITKLTHINFYSECLPSGECLIKFEDNGPGIPQKFHEQLLLPYAKFGQLCVGEGLGLAYCNCIVTHHGGQLFLSTSSSGGLGVNIKLPKDKLIT